MWSASSHVARCSRHRPRADLIRAPGEVNRAVCVCRVTRLMSRGAHVTDHTDPIRAPGEVNRAVCVWSDSSHVARCSRHRPH